MAAVVSHAMRRFPLTTPDTSYSYGLRGEASSKPWAPAEEGSSALSRSMRYADPWLYGSVRAPGGLVLAPAFVLCTCSDYINGTKRSPKKSPTTCKKCKGARLPLSAAAGAPKFGTVRCYAAASPTQPLRAGTARVRPAARPSILPAAADPYDLMRRSRLATAGESQFRARSSSPGRARGGDGRSLSAGRRPSDGPTTLGRKSILECTINPYELMGADSEPRDASITLVSGQRIRVRPTPAPDYEDVQPRAPAPRSSGPLRAWAPAPRAAATPPPALVEREAPAELSAGGFKSILKKRATTTFNDTVAECREASPSPARPKSGSHFYLPMPSNAPRKKVQFLVENELAHQQQQNDDHHRNGLAGNAEEGQASEENHQETDAPSDIDNQNNSTTPKGETVKKVCKLRRSESERSNHDLNKVVFHDTMALRCRKNRVDTRSIFNGKDLERLDGLTSKTRRISPATSCGMRPSQPPPPPPPPAKASEEPKHHVDEQANTDEEAKPKSDNIKLTNSINCNPALSSSQSENHEPSIVKGAPPSAPPRKRSNNKQPYSMNMMQEKQTVKVESPSPPANRTVVQINGSSSAPVHKLQIKNEFSSSTINVNSVPITDTPQRKTSIMINGDDCYSTVNVNDDVPLYQSSVVVSDHNIADGALTRSNNNKKSSSIYIGGNFANLITENHITANDSNSNCNSNSNYNVDCVAIKDIKSFQIEEELKANGNADINMNGTKTFIEAKSNTLIDTFSENNIPTSALLQKLLQDPVEAVKLNLVPHVCGKSDVSRRQHSDGGVVIASPSVESTMMELKNYEFVDNCSEHSSSTQYELMDNGSECYTDHSNRSSVTEDELANRTKFYELLADSAVVEVGENEDHHYESIKVSHDPIYEEIEIPPPLPANPPPSSLLDDLQLDKEYTTRSIFEGASKYDILSYLVDAKERVQEDNYGFAFPANDEEGGNRASHLSSVSDSSEDNSLIMANTLIDEKGTFQKSAEVERNDSGVGSETSKSSLSKYRTKPETAAACEDCEATIESQTETEPLICRKCSKRRTERKEIITEIVETEEKYSRDLQIILEEFYQPMLVAGLLTPEQLSAIFLNVEELLENSQGLAERLRDAVEIAVEQGDEDLLTVNIGKLFLEAAPMLHGFEAYCVRQGAASLLLASLEKDKELLRIFLRVSQMENTMLRRMNLNSFLMVPVQRVTKYPLLLARLYKVTPPHHGTREQLKEAQHKVELHLNHMNSETKDVPSKLWRRIGSNAGRRSSTEVDLANIKLRKIAVDVLEWNHDEAKFALEGKLLFTQPTDNNWRKGRTIKLTPVNALLVLNGKTTRPERSEDGTLVFSRHSVAREAALLLVRDKNGRYSLLREPLYLDRCVIAADPAWQSYFEVQEIPGKDTFIFKAEDEDQTRTWYNQLQYYAQGMGAWRKRRNALANIMINGMGLRT